MVPLGSGLTMSQQNITNDTDDLIDDLGYYEDGVKRTLTDEQIEIFRHSEIESLRRAASENPKNLATMRGDFKATSGTNEDAQMQGPDSADDTMLQTSQKKRKKKGPKRFTQEPKPDLRKRTWDIVEAGLGSLDYD